MSGARLEILDLIDSTSAEAKRRATAGETGPLWLMARRQTAGYGRRGGAWRQAEGDLAATLLFSLGPGEAAADAAQLSFAAALAVSEACARFAPSATFTLKWPNDVLMDGGKLCGLMLELLGPAGGAPVLCLGIGVNIAGAPAGLDRRTARLRDVAGDGAPSSDALLVAIDEAFSAWRSLWRRDGFAPVRAAWTAQAHGIGRRARIVVRAGEQGEEASGVFRGADAAGALVLETPQGVRSFTAGSLFFDEG